MVGMIKIASKRSNIELIGEILSLGETTKTRMSYSVNMSHAQTKAYLHFLLSKGYMRQVDEYDYEKEKERVRFQPTEKGKRALKAIKSIGDVIELNV